MGGSGIIWAIFKSFVPHSRQITTPAPRHSDALPDAQPTIESKWQNVNISQKWQTASKIQYIILSFVTLYEYINNWSTYFDIRPHLRLTWTVELYSPGSATVYLI